MRGVEYTLIRATGREVTAAADIWALDNPIVPIGPSSRSVSQFTLHESKQTYLVQSDRSRSNCGCCEVSNTNPSTSCIDRRELVSLEQ